MVPLPSSQKVANILPPFTKAANILPLFLHQDAVEKQGIGHARRRGGRWKSYNSALIEPSQRADRA